MQPEPWREEFPIDWSDDDDVTRRRFIAFLTLVSGGLFAGTLLVGARQRLGRKGESPGAMRLEGGESLPVGGAMSFRYPTPDDPCLLIRLAPETFVAYQQACTHLGCPVTYRAGSDRLRCPCHEGYFSVADGRPLAGPPKRPLARIALEIREDGIRATGVVQG